MKKANKRPAEAAASPRTPSSERQQHRRRRKTTEAVTPSMPQQVDVRPLPTPLPSSLPPPWTRESLSHAARTLAALEPQRLAPLIEKHGVPFEKLLPKTKVKAELTEEAAGTEEAATAATTATTAPPPPTATATAALSGSRNLHRDHHHHFATLARAIVGQQVSGAAAATIYARLLSACHVGGGRGDGRGGGLREGGASSPRPPSPRPPSLTPESLLDVPLPALRAAGLSERKASYLVGLAERFLAPVVPASDPASNPGPGAPPSHPSLSDRLDELAAAGDSEAMIAELVSVRGVGEWTAQMHVLFHAGGPDVLPTGDLGIKKGFARLFGSGGGSGGGSVGGGSGGGGSVAGGRGSGGGGSVAGGRGSGVGGSGGGDEKRNKKKASPSSLPSEAQMISWAEPFRPYRSLLSYYLWRAASE